MNDKNRNQTEPKIHRRPVWIILFAAILIATAGIASAQDLLPNQTPQNIQTPPSTVTVRLNGQNYELPARNSDAKPTGKRTGSRPKYAQVSAAIANFDADSDPDGWRVEVAVFDKQDRPVVMRASATFEIQPRMPTGNFVGFVDSGKPVRWSKPLKFDDDGVARLKLPMTQKLRPYFKGLKPILSHPQLGHRAFDRDQLNRRGEELMTEWREELAMPSFGEIRVRVSVPTEGVFEAVSPVRIRPTTVINTNWPY